MPGINVSALSGGDLRRLLKVAHARRDGLLADRLEWEIAARATSGGHPPAAFATLPDDDEDEPVERIVAPDAEAGAPEFADQEPAKAPRGVLLVTLGAVAGSLLSASVFWGLERMNMRQPPGPAEPQPATAMAAGPAAPAPQQLVEAFTPATLPPSPQAIASEAAPAVTVEAPLPVAPAAKVETMLAAAAAPVEVAKAAPAKKQAATKAALKTKAAPKPKKLRIAKAERPPRPPNLAEWLAKSEPDEPIR